jgi:putative thioredoxin
MNFDLEILKKSHEIPIVVDFWAPWCGPCQTLGPIIEELAAQSNGRWQLIKVNTDEQPELMQRYGIRGIPAVKMFIDGEVKDEFTGLLPKHEIEKWLDKNIPDPRMDTFRKIKEDVVSVEKFVEENPDLMEARLQLVRLLVFSDPTRCLVMLEDTKKAPAILDDLMALEQLATFLTRDYPSGQGVAQKLANAKQTALIQNHEETVSLLIESIMMDKSYEDELARKTCIAYFHFLGVDHEVTKTFRRRFDMALY